MDRDSSEILTHQFAFAGVKSGTELETQRAHVLSDRKCTSYRARGSIEGSEESIAGRIDFATSELGELGADHALKAFEQSAPLSVTKLCCSIGRSDDINEQYRGEKPVWVRAMANAGHELLDLVENRVLVSYEIV